jgi:hypothetical protein
MLLLIAGCGTSDRPPAPVVPDGKPNEGLRTVRLKIGASEPIIEIADTDATLKTGMMYRDSIPGNRGMLFIFPDSNYRGFWMKNTRIPLDIAYIDEDGVIKEIYQMKPYVTDTTRSHYKVKYALEMNEGWFESQGIKAGYAIDLSPLTETHGQDARATEATHGQDARATEATHGQDARGTDETHGQDARGTEEKNDPTPVASP